MYCRLWKRLEKKRLERAAWRCISLARPVPFFGGLPIVAFCSQRSNVYHIVITILCVMLTVLEGQSSCSALCMVVSLLQ